MRVVVTIADPYTEKMDIVISDLERKGFILLERLKAIGVLIGETDNAVDALSTVPGVISVVADTQTFKLSSSDSKLNSDSRKTYSVYKKKSPADLAKVNSRW